MVDDFETNCSNQNENAMKFFCHFISNENKEVTMAEGGETWGGGE